MIGYPISCNYEIYVNEYLLKHTYSDSVDFIASGIAFLIWVVIGVLLYNRNPTTNTESEDK